MAEEQFEILNMVHTPPDFPTWPDAQKIDFYRRAVDWHAYIEELQKEGHVTQAWGTQKLPGRVRAHGTKAAFVAIYKATFDKFSELLIRDPLWNSAFYKSPILKSIKGDYDDDLARLQTQKKYLETRMSTLLPDSTVTFQGVRPTVKKGNIQVLVGQGNTPGWHDLSDVEQMAIYEKVLQMHDYYGFYRNADVMQEWGTYQNCGIGITEGPNSAKGVWIASVESYDQFDQLFQVQPMRNNSLVFTYVLIPFEESWKRSKMELKTFVESLAR